MGKLCRLIVSGPSAVGKTSMIEQCIYGNYTSKGPSDFFPTYEDTYNAVVETDRGTKEKVRIYELGGKAKIERHFVNCADVFILVYDIGDVRTLHAVQMLKRQLEECRGKREIFFVFCGNKADKPKDPSLDSASLSDWAQRERVHLFETSVLDRQALCNVLTWIVSRVTQSPGKSSFPFGKKESRPFVNVAGAKSEAE
ncbi:NF-kappa-B inhibitor-interacting Ras-like protein 2 [Clonorchis sinensis]|uniref:NF-kappa-B inhibitor-interacting Ras-like protein 2 n=1 Tax=Clonorchis sinensis TaxID=79923 RepID=A0A8T1MFQ3_CLOSI|nr:NF-kappa-B inhibitor-interacting Ras-like protein 2 [Clonorchis sinensis]